MTSEREWEEKNNLFCESSKISARQLKRDLKKGLIEKGKWVLYQNEQLIAISDRKEEIMEILLSNEDFLEKPSYFTCVGYPQRM